MMSMIFLPVLPPPAVSARVYGLSAVGDNRQGRCRDRRFNNWTSPGRNSLHSGDIRGPDRYDRYKAIVPSALPEPNLLMGQFQKVGLILLGDRLKDLVVALAVEPPPVKLIIGLIAREAPITAIRRQLEATCGPIDQESVLLRIRTDSM